ncbi:MAG: NAD(P)H-dependent oxidoreductase subunit E [Bacteroidales bacterium]|nr:NAD(P)H-dependent oxidoreductase subunit E [Bacteroidales bacterium]
MIEKVKVVICLGSSCYSRGNARTLEVVKEYLAKNKLAEKTDFRGKLCSNDCNHGPVLTINDQKHHNVTETSAVAIMDSVFKKMKTV